VRRLLPLRAGVPWANALYRGCENTDKVRNQRRRAGCRRSTISTNNRCFSAVLRGSLSHGRLTHGHGFEVASYNTSRW